jgi:hypothetical protein
MGRATAFGTRGLDAVGHDSWRKLARVGVTVVMASACLSALPRSAVAAGPSPATGPDREPAPVAAPILRPGDAGTSSPTPGPAASSAPDPATPVPAPTPTVYQVNLYQAAAVRWQDPDTTACTAASALGMLNTIFYSGSDPSMVWHPTTKFAAQESILAYERAHMTMSLTSPGSDPHGWRNALNYYGWGSINAGVYVDAAYSSFDSAAKAAIVALAQTRKPVGILAEYGRHAEFITGYKVTNADPATGSLDFTILGVYLTDPNRSGHRSDSWISYTAWRTGPFRVQFFPYEQADSPRRDKVDGRVAAWREWLGKWVIIAPVK